MLTFTKIQTNHKHYDFVEELLHQSFPLNERRDDDCQRFNTDNNPLFHCYLITENVDEKEESLIGLITVWELNGFRYVEHLATSPAIRNKGYGKLTMEALKKRDYAYEQEGALCLFRIIESICTNKDIPGSGTSTP